MIKGTFLNNRARGGGLRSLSLTSITLCCFPIKTSSPWSLPSILQMTVFSPSESCWGQFRGDCVAAITQQRWIWLVDKQPVQDKLGTQSCFNVLHTYMNTQWWFQLNMSGKLKKISQPVSFRSFQRNSKPINWQYLQSFYLLQFLCHGLPQTETSSTVKVKVKVFCSLYYYCLWAPQTIVKSLVGNKRLISEYQSIMKGTHS